MKSKMIVTIFGSIITFTAGGLKFDSKDLPTLFEKIKNFKTWQEE